MTVASSLALLSMLMPPVSIVSSASVALVTLRLGAAEGFYVLLSSLFACVALGLLLIGSVQFALLYGVVLWVPIWFIAIVLREGRHLSVAIEIAVLLAATGVIGFYAFYPEPAEMWKAMVALVVQPMLDSSADASADQIKTSIENFSHYMTGAVAAGTVYGLLFGLFLARWWQATLYNPGGFKSEFLAMRGSSRLAFSTLAVMAASTAMSGTLAEAGWNVVVLLFVFYTVIGTAVLHAVFATMKTGRYMVPFLYVTLFIVPHMMIVVAIVGLADTWMNLRKKISNQHST